MRRFGVDPETALTVRFIILIISLEPFDMGIAFEGEHMRCDPV